MSEVDDSRAKSLALAVGRFGLRLLGRDALADYLGDASDIARSLGGRSLPTPKDEGFVQVIAEFFERSMKIEFRHLEDGDKTAAVLGVVKTLDEVPESQMIRVALRDSTEFEAVLVNSGGRLIRSRLLSEGAQEYFDVLLNRTAAVVAHWVVDTDTHGRTERIALGGISRQVQSLEAQLNVLLSSEALTKRVDEGRGEAGAFLRQTIQYLGRVRERLDFMDIPGLDLVRSRLRYKFSSNYIPLTVSDFKTGATHHVATASDLLSLSQLLLVVGEPGAGKTTLTKLASVGWAEHALHALAHDEPHLIPLLVKLRAEPALPPDISQIGGQLARPLGATYVSDWQRMLLESGRAAVIVDGLDEVSEHRRIEMIQWVRNLADSFPAARFVVTTRPAALTGLEPEIAPYSRVDVQRLERWQVKNLVSKWHLGVARQEFDSDDEAVAASMAFVERLDQRSEIRLLCENPLIAASLCGLSAARGGNLPSSRREIYTELVRMLAKRRDEERGVVDVDLELSLTEALGLIRALAWQCQLDAVDEGPRASFLPPIRKYQELCTREKLREARAGRVLDSLVSRSGLLREVPVDRIDWSHKTFREFFAAQQMLMPEAARDAEGRANSPEWHEVYAWAIELTESPTQAAQLIGAFMDVAQETNDKPLLGRVFRAASSAVALDPETRARIETAIGSVIPPRDKTDLRTIVELGDGAVEAVTQALRTPSPEVEGLLVAALLEIGTDASVEALTSLDTDVLFRFRAELGGAYAESSSINLAHRVLGRVPASVHGVQKLDLVGNRFLESLSGISRAFEVRRLRLEGSPIRIDEVPRAEAHVGLLDASEVDPNVALALLAKLPNVRAIRLSLDHARERRPVDAGGTPVTQALQALWLSGLAIDLDELSGFTGLRVLRVDGRARGRLDSVAGGPISVALDTVDEVEFSGKTKRLFIAEWPFEDLSKLTGLSDLEVLTIASGELLSDISALASLPSLRRVEIRQCPGVELSADVSGLGGLESLVLQPIPYLGVGVSPEVLEVLNLDEVPLGHGAAEFPPLHLFDRLDERCFAVQGDEIEARGWNDPWFWEQLPSHQVLLDLGGGDQPVDEEKRDFAEAGMTVWESEEAHRRFSAWFMSASADAVGNQEEEEAARKG